MIICLHHRRPLLSEREVLKVLVGEFTGLEI
jgi:hypothetical protein